MDGETVVKIMDLPEGQDYCWYADLHVLVLSSRLDAEGRARAADDLVAKWRNRLTPFVAA